MKIVSVTAEFAPIAKAGGLGEMVVQADKTRGVFDHDGQKWRADGRHQAV